MTNGDKNQVIEVAGLIAAKCPSCGGILSLKKGGEVICEFCNTEFFLHDAYKGTNEKVQNFFELAYSAQEGNNAGEAYKYFTKVLEVDTTESLAWFGKGTSTLGRSTGYSLNTKEAITCFNKALEYTSTTERDNLKARISEASYYYASALYNWLWRLGWLEVGNSRDTMELFFYADEMREFDIPTTKSFINILCSGLPVDYTEKVNYYSGRVRRIEPKYKNPFEIRRRNKKIQIYVISGLILAVVIFCALLCNSIKS